MDFLKAGQRIRESRKLAGLTQAELAKETGLSVMSVRRYEFAERKATVEVYILIAKALGVDVNWLMHGQTLEEIDSARAAKLAARHEEVKNEFEAATKNIEEKTKLLNRGGRLRLSSFADDLASIPEYLIKSGEPNANEEK